MVKKLAGQPVPRVLLEAVRNYDPNTALTSLLANALACVTLAFASCLGRLPNGRGPHPHGVPRMLAVRRVGFEPTRYTPRKLEFFS